MAERSLSPHIRRLSSIPSFGKKRKLALEKRFPTKEDLERATIEDLQEVESIGPKLAEKLLVAIKSEGVVQIWNRERRVTVWNRCLQRKVSGAAAPKESEVDAWLARHKDTHEIYTSQDLAQKGPSQVPDDCLLDQDAFLGRIVQPSVSRLEEKIAVARAPELAEALAQYSLKVLCDSLRISDAGRAAPGTLPFALLHAATNLGGDVNALHTKLDGADCAGSPLLLLTAAHELLRRPLWVWMHRAAGAAASSADSSDFSIYVFGDIDATQATPLRLVHSAGLFFALAPSDADTELPVELEQAAATEAEPARLPDLKEDVDRALSDTTAQFGQIEAWSKANLAEEYDLSTAREQFDDLRERLVSGKGLDAAFLGTNGVGKSTICNLLILNSSVDSASYKLRANDYVPEALLDFWPADTELPVYESLRDDPTGKGNANVRFTLLKPGVPLLTKSGEPLLGSAPLTVEEADGIYAQTEKAVKDYSGAGGDKPQLKRFVLPCGKDAASTTSLHTRVRYGSVVHLVVEHYTIEELQRKAFDFVKLMLDLDGESARELEAPRLSALKEAWYAYINITRGPVMRKDLPRISQLPKPETLVETWKEIAISEKLRDIVSTPVHVYLGSGESLNFDRIMVHDLVCRFNDKDQLYRYAVKSLDNYQPAAVLEGGNGLVDLPGLNDSDTGCLAQTREGIKEAGVIFVVLAKSLYEDEASVQLLKDTDTVKRAALGEADVVFLFNREPQPGYKHRQLATEEETEVQRDLKEKTLEKWEELLLDANDEMLEENSSVKDEDAIKAVASATPMRAIYPMLHSSFKLNWESSEANKETAEELCGSVNTFELSNVTWLLGILEKLNRGSLIKQLHELSSITLPTLLDKLKGSLEDAKNAEGGLPAELVRKAAKFLTGARSLDGQIGVKATELVGKVNELNALGQGQEGTSVRLQLRALAKEFASSDASVIEFLRKGRGLSVERWGKMDKAMKRASQAVHAVDPSKKGNALNFSLMPMIFGSNSRKVPFSFQPLVDGIEAKLSEMYEKVVDLVIAAADELIGADMTQSTVFLKETFLQLDVIKPLQLRFSMIYFIRAGQRDQMLNSGQLDSYLKKLAAQLTVKAVKVVILDKASSLTTLGDIKNLIESNRENVRTEWQHLLAGDLEKFLDGQFKALANDLMYHSKKTQSYSVKSMLTHFLKHIVNTDKMQRNDTLQKELLSFLNDLRFKSESLHSLWARLDGQDSTEELGAAAARFVDRRRQLQIATSRAKEAYTLGKPDRAMPVTRLTTGHQQHTTRFDSLPMGAKERVFPDAGDNGDAIEAVMESLRKSYRLRVVSSAGGAKDLFSAVAQVMFRTDKLKRLRGADDTLPLGDAVKLAAAQLRALTVSHIAHYYRIDERAAKAQDLLCEPVQQYIERLDGDYRGDLVCLWSLATHFRCAFRVWLPDQQSILFPLGPNTRTGSCAFQLMLTTSSAGSSGAAPSAAESCCPTWFPVVTVPKRVTFGDNTVKTFVETDDEREAKRAHMDEIERGIEESKRQRI